MDKKSVTLFIDDKLIQVPEETKIIEACKKAGIIVPSLCYLKDVSAHGSCGICVVEVEGNSRLVRSCMNTVQQDMVIYTHTDRVMRARKLNLELLLANHPLLCTNCERNLNCELQTLAQQLGIKESRFSRTKKALSPIDSTSVSIVRDPNACILCNRCVEVCATMQGVHAIDMMQRGLRTTVSTFFDEGLSASVCTNCGQCSLVCPTGAITEKSQEREVFDAINNPNLMVIVQTAPAIRVGLGEAMGLEEGSLVTGKMVSALRSLGFDRVFDTQFSADLTIMEEAHELIHRLSTGGTLPMITSCSPGWISFIETFYPEETDHLSTCKSPQQMFGSIAKTYYAEKTNIDPRSIRVVSIMPCTAKKYEAGRSEIDSAFDYWKEKKSWSEDEYFCDVDYVLTTRELARMLKRIGLDFEHLQEEKFDDPLGESTGSAVLFGATGGVMEAALRSAYEIILNKKLEALDFEQIRIGKGIREATITLGEKDLKVAVANTLSNARILLEQIKEGKSPYAFIEVMTCPDGCLGGGGQPIPSTSEIRKKRAESIYEEDRGKPIRKSHENPSIKELYSSFLGKPLGKLSHELLHTTYIKRSAYEREDKNSN